jgi:hypothetical protein
MCTGIEIALLAAGAAASAGGAMITRNETAKNAAAQAQARNAELRASTERQRAYENRSRTEGVQKALDRFDPDEQAKAQAEETARRDTAIKDAVTPTAGVEDIPLATGTDNAPTVVKDNMGKRLRDVFNLATDRAKLSAKPLTYADVLAGNNVSLTEAGRVVDTGNSFARQEAAILPSQQDFASYIAQQQPSVWGPLLGAAGGALSGFAGSGYAGKIGGKLLGAGTAAAAPAAAAATTFSGAPVSFLDNNPFGSWAK